MQPSRIYWPIAPLPHLITVAYSCGEMIAASLTLHLYDLSLDDEGHLGDDLLVDAVLRGECHDPCHLLGTEHNKLAVDAVLLLQLTLPRGRVGGGQPIVRGAATPATARLQARAFSWGACKDRVYR